MLLLIPFLHLAVLKQLEAGPGGLGKINERIINEIVDSHNEYRRNVKPSASNMVKMQWSHEAADSAAEWAKTCPGRRSRMRQRVLNGVQCAESTLQLTYFIPWKEVVTTWFKRSSNFEYGKGAVNSKRDILMYTQLIWYNTYEIGCAYATCSENEYHFYFICRYCPAGNVQGQILTPYKEGPPCGDCPNNCDNKLCTNPCKYQDKAYACDALKKTLSCSMSPLKEECVATCNCQTEII